MTGKAASRQAQVEVGTERAVGALWGAVARPGGSSDMSGVAFDSSSDEGDPLPAGGGGTRLPVLLAQWGKDTTLFGGEDGTPLFHKKDVVATSLADWLKASEDHDYVGSVQPAEVHAALHELYEDQLRYGASTGVASRRHCTHLIGL